MKEKLEKLPHLLSWVVKLAVFHACLGLLVLVLWLFLPAQLDMNGLQWMPIALYALCLFCFVVYDVAMTKLITFYLIRLRKRFRIK